MIARQIIEAIDLKDFDAWFNSSRRSRRNAEKILRLKAARLDINSNALIIELFGAGPDPVAKYQIATGQHEQLLSVARESYSGLKDICAKYGLPLNLSAYTFTNDERASIKSLDPGKGQRAATPAQLLSRATRNKDSEQILLARPEWAIRYAFKHHFAWKEAETAAEPLFHKPGFITDCIRYASVISYRWKALEDALLDRPNCWGVVYAENVIGGRWQEFEKVLLDKMDIRVCVAYANSVVHGVWPELEVKIMADEHALPLMLQYANLRHVRAPQIEDQLVDIIITASDARDLDRIKAIEYFIAHKIKIPKVIDFWNSKFNANVNFGGDIDLAFSEWDDAKNDSGRLFRLAANYVGLFEGFRTKRARQLIEAEEPDIDAAFSDLEDVNAQLLREKAEKLVAEYLNNNGGHEEATKDVIGVFSRVLVGEHRLSAKLVRDARLAAVAYMADDTLYQIFATEDSDVSDQALHDAVYSLLNSMFESLLDKSDEMFNAKTRVEDQRNRSYATPKRSI
jgi:hypothetical protein